MILKLEERLDGAIGERGRFTGYTINKKGEKKKDATNILTGRNILKVKNILDCHQLKLFKMEMGAKGYVVGLAGI